MNIWKFQSQLTRRLLIWSLLSMLAGGILQIPHSRFTSALGQQFAAWGLIDALIAIFGQQSSQRRAAQLPDPLAEKVMQRETQLLGKILWVNTGLDVGYVTGGAVLALTKGKPDPVWRGHGIGIIIQGGFLLIFDLIHARRIDRGVLSNRVASIR